MTRNLTRRDACKITALAAAAPLLAADSGVFRDAIAAWHFANNGDSAGKNSPVVPRGDVLLGVPLTGRDRELSLERGGDGFAAELRGGWLDARQGAGNELVVTGSALTLAIRFRASATHWGFPIMAKHGGPARMAFSIYSGLFEDEMMLSAELGSDEISGFHRVKTPVATLALDAWHDVLVRFDGKVLQLFVDGSLRDEEVAVGTVRKARDPFLIGAGSELDAFQGRSSFRGWIDHAAIWDQPIPDRSVAGLHGVSQLADKRPVYYSEAHRPQFHFSARKHWLNDPNGLYFYNGVYNMCFQLMPPGRPGAYKDWGRAVSTDLVHWKETPAALTPHKLWGGCWSGSAVVDSNNTSGFQSGKEKPIVAILTNGGTPGAGPNCTQCIAYSTDGGKSFTYYDRNPVLAHIVGSNRDPKVFWHEPTAAWIMALYLVNNDYALFRSPDLKRWEKTSQLTFPDTIECPDLFEMPVDGKPDQKKWVFWGGNGNYMVGTFDGRSFRKESGIQRADFGNNFYAGLTWSDIPSRDGRTLQIAWMSGGEYPHMPFTQQMAFATEVTLRTTTEGIRMFRVPAREIEKLYLRTWNLNKTQLKAGVNPLREISGELFRVQLAFEPGAASSVGLKVRGEPIHWNAAQSLLSCLGRSAPLTPVQGTISLDVLIDRTSIEVFANGGQVVLSSCFLPPAEQKSLEVFSEGGEAVLASASVHALKSIWS